MISSNLHNFNVAGWFRGLIAIDTSIHSKIKLWSYIFIEFHCNIARYWGKILLGRNLHFDEKPFHSGSQHCSERSSLLCKREETQAFFPILDFHWTETVIPESLHGFIEMIFDTLERVPLVCVGLWGKRKFIPEF